MKFNKGLCLVILMCLAAMPAAHAQANEKSSKADQGPSYDDTVKWIQDNIGEAGLPGATDGPDKFGLKYVYDDVPYTLKFDGCDLHLRFATHSHMTDTTPVRSDDQTETDTGYALDVYVPLGKVVFVTSDDVFAPSITNSINPKLAPRSLPTVSIALPNDVGTFSATWNNTDASVGNGSGSISKKLIPMQGLFQPLARTNVGTGAVISFKSVQIWYGMPGTEDSPKHMAAAISHLADICRNRPDQVSKPLF